MLCEPSVMKLHFDNKLPACLCAYIIENFFYSGCCKFYDTIESLSVSNSLYLVLTYIQILRILEYISRYS